MATEFPSEGTHLERYARRLNAVEINSSFYRPHQHKTYRRWADATPDAFRFTVKAPRQITHERRLIDAAPDLERFLHEVIGLGGKLGAILIQLPPSLRFNESTEVSFFRALRDLTDVSVVCEPRHVSWFAPGPEALMCQYEIGRVATDPALVPAAGEPAGCQKDVYFRWHGSPRIYYSTYDSEMLSELARRLRANAQKANRVWCVFDNTAEGAALLNALDLGRTLNSTAPVNQECSGSSRSSASNESAS